MPMPACASHTYAYSPGLVNVRSTPVPQAGGGDELGGWLKPSAKWTLWKPPSLTQCTVVPGFTAMRASTNVLLVVACTVGPADWPSAGTTAAAKPARPAGTRSRRRTTRMKCDAASVPRAMSSMHAIAADDIIDTFAGAVGNERPPLLVRRPLEAFLDERGLGSGELDIEPVGEGHSNVTYAIRRGGAEFVLRRPPRPPL